VQVLGEQRWVLYILSALADQIGADSRLQIEQLCQVQKYPQYKFINLDLLDTCATTNNLLPIERFSNYTFVRGDIGNMDLVPTSLERLRPHI
jgi:hypothetical protein